MVFQSYAIWPHMTVLENVAYALEGRRIPKAERRTLAMAALEGVKLAHLADRPAPRLSGGQQQRVAIARAMVGKPQVLLFDEPLSNLDARLRVQMRGELKRLQHELGTTTVYVTHDQAEAMTLAHRVAVMRGGRLQQFDTPMNIYNYPANRFVAEFVGSPSMNFIEGRVGASERMFTSDDLMLPLPDTLIEQLNNQERITLGIRPEHVHVSIAEQQGWTPATVYVTELMGNETFVFLRLSGGEKIIARAAADFRAELEMPVWIRFETDKAAFFDADSGEAIMRS
jgi:multiple sugar transport system ATP-binding protein